VGDLLKFKNGLNKGKAYFGYGTPIVNYMDVFKYAGLKRSNVQGLVDVTNAEKKAFSARKGDVLFTRTSETPEEVGVSTVLLDDIEDAVFSGFVLRGRPVNDRLTPDFAQYCFNSWFVRDQIVSSATYTTRALTNGRLLSGVKLPLPDDTNEQQAIAAALSDADGVVAGLERVIAKKRLIKQGAAQDLLTARRRLPGFSGEWEVKRLGAALTVKHGRSQKQVEHPTGEYPILATGGLIGMATKYLCDKPSVLIGRKGTIDVPRFMDKPFWTVDTLFYTDVHAGYDAKFLFYAFLQIDWMSYNEASGVPSLNAKTIENIEMPIPEITEQQAIAAVLSDMDAEIQTLKFRLTKARAVKEGMMQNLLTGRVRLV
jgi:type I restriction enzyme S subunit